LIHEFESAKQSAGGLDSACLPVAAEGYLSGLHGFIGRKGEGTFHARFARPYDAAIEVILDEGLKV
jgi:hypothetical protein